MKMTSALSLIVICAHVVGCASPQIVDLEESKLHQEFDLNQATITSDNEDPVVVIEGTSPKGRAIAKSTAIGGLTGMGAGAIACAGSWILAPFCIAVVAAAGAGGGAATGALTFESTNGIEAKRSMLTEALSAPIASQRLVTLVEQKRLEAAAFMSPSIENIPTIAEPEWTLRIAVTELATVGSGRNTPYLLQASANLEVVRAGNSKPTFVKDYKALSPMKMSTAEWRANDDELLRSALEGILATLATEIVNDLRPKAESLAVLKSETNQSPSLVEKEASKPDQVRLFDPKTGMNWVVVDTSPVDLSTANSICGSLETGDKKKYRLSSLSEFEELWTRYKNDERISAFKKREYVTDSKNFFGSANYPQTFSFASGTTGQPWQLRAAYLTCVSQ